MGMIGHRSAEHALRLTRFYVTDGNSTNFYSSGRSVDCSEPETLGRDNHHRPTRGADQIDFVFI